MKGEVENCILFTALTFLKTVKTSFHLSELLYRHKGSKIGSVFSHTSFLSLFLNLVIVQLL